ncbi:MAG: hypothetical protein K8Q89_03910 [Nitrosarchaeum sp.]|nr:hypothetical protein [Nitrosarchaeum sp.]
MTLLKINNIRILILVSVCIFAVAIVLGFMVYSCGFRHITIMNDLKSYEKSLDPEFCDALVEKINLFNLDCKPEVDILDCG